MEGELRDHDVCRRHVVKLMSEIHQVTVSTHAPKVADAVRGMTKGARGSRKGSDGSTPD